MKSFGYAAASKSAPLAPWSFDRREPNPNDVVVAIDYCGICHSDIHQVKGEWGAELFPMVPGPARSSAASPPLAPPSRASSQAISPRLA